MDAMARKDMTCERHRIMNQMTRWGRTNSLCKGPEGRGSCHYSNVVEDKRAGIEVPVPSQMKPVTWQEPRSGIDLSAISFRLLS